MYLDYAATRSVLPEVVAEVTTHLTDTYGNPSSVSTIGKKAKRVLEASRERIATALQVDVNSVYFTSGATESNNWLIRTQAWRARQLGKGKHIVCLAVEHPSVMAVCEQLETEGFTVSQVAVSPTMTDEALIEAFESLTTDQTIGWVMMAVNNELGTVYPVQLMTERAKARRLWCHVDAVQALGKIDLPWGNIGTSLTFSGHKIGAPKGIGLAIYQPEQSEMTLTPLLVGGGQERGFRSGTENVPYIAGLALAVELAQQRQIVMARHSEQLWQYLEQQLRTHHIRFERNGGMVMVPSIVSVWFPDIIASQLLIQTDLRGIAISAGSACSAGSLSPSKVVQHYYPQPLQRAQESVRLSFGLETTVDELEQLVTIIQGIYERKR